MQNEILTIELFAGVGFTNMALGEVTQFKHHRISEWNIPSMIAYAHLHNTQDEIQAVRNSIALTKDKLVDEILSKNMTLDGKKPVTAEQLNKKKIEWLKNIYTCIKITNNMGNIQGVKAADLGIEPTKTVLMSYSFPCQDLSLAGNKKGMKEGTRSGLLWEVERILLELGDNLPQILLMENVPQVHGKKNIEDWSRWLEALEQLGYTNYWQDLNAKDHGIPQNRNRTFMVSYLDKNKHFQFPAKQPLELVLHDLLETTVDEKYYITNAILDSKLNSTFTQCKNIVQQKEYCDTILARDYKDPKLVLVGNLVNTPFNKMHESSRRVYDTNGLAPTINTVSGGNLQPKIVQRIISEHFYKGRPKRIYKTVCPALRAERAGLHVEETQYRLYNQAINTAVSQNAHIGDIIDPYNKKVIKSGICPTITTRPEGLKTAILPVVGAIRNRPDECGKNAPNLELNKNGTSNALTTITKDNVVVETTVIQYPRGVNKGGVKKVKILPCFTKSSFQTNLFLVVKFRIRKLTPKECWRLMGTTDAEFERARHGLNAMLYGGKDKSGSQLYSMAGNGIVKQVLVNIYKQIFTQ